MQHREVLEVMMLNVSRVQCHNNHWQEALSHSVFCLQVQVSMKFNGQSSVEVHPPSNLEELKTVTSISMFMRVDPDKDPIEDRFILYLGDRHVRNPSWLFFHIRSAVMRRGRR